MRRAGSHGQWECSVVLDGQRIGLPWFLWLLARKAFRFLNSCFCLAACLLGPWTPWSVLETPFVGEIAEFFASKLNWTNVTYYNVWNFMSCEVSCQLLYGSARFCVMKVVDFPEI